MQTIMTRTLRAQMVGLMLNQRLFLVEFTYQMKDQINVDISTLILLTNYSGPNCQNDFIKGRDVVPGEDNLQINV